MATDPKGIFDRKVAEAYLAEKGKLYTDDDVEYWYDPERLRALTASPATVWGDAKGARYALPDLGQCLVMDVGCWAGNGPKKSDKDHERHREFGVVCGDVAALCSFPDKAAEAVFGLSDKGKKALGDAGGLPAYETHIEPLLQHLSKAGLGNVSVMNALAVNNDKLVGGRWWASDPTLHVFLGDFHLPAISVKDSAYLGVNDGPHVPRAGRLDLSDRVKAQAAAAAAVVATGWWNPLPKIAAALVGFDGGCIWEEEQINRWDPRKTDGFVKTDGLMQKKEAAQWADFYLGANGNKGAEIFQSATEDLLKFLAQLESFAHEHQDAKLHLVQTGDFLDFWIGFKCGFGENLVLKNGALPFVEYWYDRMAAEAPAAQAPKPGEKAMAVRAGRVIKAFRELKEKKRANLEVTLLYGNHDKDLRTTHGLKAEHCPARSIVYAEHGHQSDGFNCDDDPRLGWALTQAAFFWPSIRDKEDSLATGWTRVKRNGGVVFTDPGARLQRIGHAADVCLEKGRSVYVLGHTHQAMLKKVTIRPQLSWSEVCASSLQWSGTTSSR